MLGNKSTLAPSAEAPEACISTRIFEDDPPLSGDVTVEIHLEELSDISLKTVAADTSVAYTGYITSPSSTLGVLSSLRMYQTTIVQLFYFTLTELGMAFLAAVNLFTLSLIGCITVLFVERSSTTDLARRFQILLDEVIGVAAREAYPTSYVPNVVGVIEGSLQILLLPSLMVGAFGTWVLVDPDRRRSGKYLTGYAGLVLVLGFAFLYVLLRVFVGGQLGAWEGISINFLNTTLEKLNSLGAKCTWEDTFSCSGLSLCCVTNASVLSVSDENLLDDEELWRSLCFVTMQNGTAVRLRRSHGHGDVLEDVTALVEHQCGAMTNHIGVKEEGSIYTTACTLMGRPLKFTPSLYTSCGDYFIGHTSLAIGFNVFLIFCMSVCSLVSGFVVLITHGQRPPGVDFVMVKSSHTPAHESPLVPKKEVHDDSRRVNLKRN